MKLTPVAQVVGFNPPRSTANEAAQCTHPLLLSRVKFDEQAARGLDSSEIRKRWPRLCERCPNCGADMIMYASFMHYMAGDW